MNPSPDLHSTAAGNPRRRYLWVAICAMGLVLLAAFTWVMMSGISGGSSSNGSSLQIPEIPAGGAALVRVNGELVWIVRYSSGDELLRQLPAGTIVDSEVRTCLTPEQEYCYLAAHGTNPAFLLRYTEERPGQLARGIPWYGGFVDPENGAVYDRLGRGYAANPGGSLASLPLIEMP